MDGRAMALLFGLIGMFMAIVSMALSRSRRESEQQRRMDLIEKGLAHPALDEATRAELLRVLAAQGRRSEPQSAAAAPKGGDWWHLLWFGPAWILFVVGGSMLGAHALSLAPGLEVQIFLPMAVTGFAMLTLPMALRELHVRRDRAAATER